MQNPLAPITAAQTLLILKGLIICAFLFHIRMADLEEYNLGVRHSFIFFQVLSSLPANFMPFFAFR